MGVRIPSSPPNMKALKDRFVRLLPAFPPKELLDSKEKMEEFIGDILDSYIESAQFYEHEVNKILMSYNRIQQGMTKEEKMRVVRELVSE
jgi:hypothetical protein